MTARLVMVRDLRAARPRIHTIRSSVDDKLADFTLASDVAVPVPVEFVQRMIDQPEEFPDFGIEPYDPAPEPDGSENGEDEGAPVDDEPVEPAVETQTEPEVEPVAAATDAPPSLREQLVALLAEGGVMASKNTPQPILIKQAAKAAREGKVPVERLEAIVAAHGGKTG